jgi:hypothetical protein
LYSDCTVDQGSRNTSESLATRIYTIFGMQRAESIQGGELRIDQTTNRGACMDGV